MKALCPYINYGFCPASKEPNHSREYRHMCFCSRTDQEHLQDFVHLCPQEPQCYSQDAQHIYFYNPNSNRQQEFATKHPVSAFIPDKVAYGSKTPNSFSLESHPLVAVPNFPVCEVGLPFTVATLNVLSESNMHIAKNLNGGEYTRKQGRMDSILRLIQYIQADIFCIQELDKQYIAFLQHFGERYTILECSENVPNTEPVCAILLNKYRFDVRNYSLIKTTSEGANSYSLWAEVALRTQDSQPERMTIMSVQLPNHELNGNSPLSQVEELLDRLHGIVVSNGMESAPVIMCGDFGCSPHSASYQLLSTGEVEQDTTDNDSGSIVTKQMKSKFQFKSSNMELHKQEPSATLVTKRLAKCVDYIWYQSPALSVVGGSILDSTRYAEELPSLHCPLVSIFKLEKDLESEYHKKAIKDIIAEIKEKDELIQKLQ
jgi:endonuclease/exonuclease/phosphatase family metal-dependent hydrolase